MEQIFNFEFVREWNAIEGDAALRKGGHQVRSGGGS